MSDPLELDLLLEIAKLLKKYGPETFDGLAKTLSSPDFSERLIEILSDTANASRKIQGEHKGQKSPRNFRSELVNLEKSEPEKGKLLLQFYDSMSAKRILPTMRDIQAFITESGLPKINVSSQSKAIIPLIKNLMIYPLVEINEKLSFVRPESPTDARGLEGWSNIILDKERGKK